MKKFLITLLLFTSASSFGNPLKDNKPSLVESEEKKENLSPPPLSPQSHEWFLTELARRGDISAISVLADSYYFGRDKSISKSPAKAFHWQKELADKDIPAGLNNMGFSLKNGVGCEKSYEKAAQAFKGAMESPLAERMPCHIALLNLSALYYGGKGVEKNVEKSLDLFTQFVKFRPGVKSLLKILEVVEKKGNMADFLLTIEPHNPHVEPHNPHAFLDMRKLFECFTRMLDKGEETENKLLQLIADHPFFDVSHISLTFIAKMVNDFYSVLGTPLPQSELKN